MTAVILSKSRMRGANRRMIKILANFSAFAFLTAIAAFAIARPSPSHNKGASPQSFLRQTNVYSNLEFFYTNRGVLFNANNGQAEGLFWPRGSGNSYIFGEGLWFATKKEIQGKRQELADIGYNPNSGAGWYIEGEAAQVGKTSTTPDNANPNNKYISYVSPRYDKLTGTYVQGSSSVVSPPQYNWPLWDTSASKTFERNYYFGDYISDVTMRNAASLEAANPDLAKVGKTPKPAIISEEDIVNAYSDEDYSGNPEWRPNTGYPFGIDIQEAIYSWSFGRYRDMIFLRQKLTNSSGNPNDGGVKDSLLDCWMAPAFDPDLGAAYPGQAGDDGNSYVNSAVVAANSYAIDDSQLREPYRSQDSLLNMAYQFRNPNKDLPNGQQYGMIGFSFLESPVIDSAGNIIANDDSAGLHGYGPNSLFQKKQEGLVTFRDWVLANDPTSGNLRYDFVSSGRHDLFNGVYGDQRLLMATGPFTLPPGKSVETIVAIDIAQVSYTDPKLNFGALLLLTDFAHQVFGEVDSSIVSITKDSLGNPDTIRGYFINHFLSPVPPDIPIVQTHSLHKAVLVTWDSTAERSVDPVSDLTGLPLSDSVLKKEACLDFMGYQLWRSTRSDHDSTMTVNAVSPDVELGSWQLYNFAKDSVFDDSGHFNHFHYRRLNTVPNPIPHSYLDYGDDTHTGQLTGSEGLYDNVPYYYYLIAFDEYDSINSVGPLYTAVVTGKNLVTGTPSLPPFLTPFNGDSAIVGSCVAGGLQDVRLDIVDTGIFAKLFTDDTISVSFQPVWTEYYNTNILDQSPLHLYVNITDTKNGLQNTRGALASPYYFPLILPGAIILHVDGTVTCDSPFVSQFTTDDATFAPNQAIDNAFHVLADINFDQLCTPYRLSSVTTPSTNQGDPNILRLSVRTNCGFNRDSTQSIFNLPGDSAPRPPIILPSKQLTLFVTTPIQTDTGYVLGTANDTVYTLDSIIKSVPDTVKGVVGSKVTYLSKAPVYHYIAPSTRPSFLGALGETTYEVTFDSAYSVPPVAVYMPGDPNPIHPHALHVKVSIAGCDSAILRHVRYSNSADSLYDLAYEYDGRYYDNQTLQSGVLFANFDDPDTMRVPQPGLFEMDAYHYTDNVPFDQSHVSASFINGTTGPYYFPIGGSDNIDNGNYHLVVHRLKVGGAEILFNAPEIPDPGATVTGDTIAGSPSYSVYGLTSTTPIFISADHSTPHMNHDFAVGDKIMLSFTGVTKNLPFPGTQFKIYTPSGNNSNFANLNNYSTSVLSQVQVVPNPYIVTDIAQASSDNAQLYFTRLPPRCTIEIYALDGTLVNTIEHVGYQSTIMQNPSTGALTDTTYNYNALSDRSSVETWNLLTSGKQRVGSQVLFARIVAKDPITGAEIGETTTKFAVIVASSGHINSIKP